MQKKEENHLKLTFMMTLLPQESAVAVVSSMRSSMKEEPVPAEERQQSLMNRLKKLIGEKAGA